MARGWLLCYLRRRRLIGAALASTAAALPPRCSLIVAPTLACVTVWREGGCCATFYGGGSIPPLCSLTRVLRLVALFLRLALAFTLACVTRCGAKVTGVLDPGSAACCFLSAALALASMCWRVRHGVARHGSCAAFSGGGAAGAVLAEAGAVAWCFLSRLSPASTLARVTLWRKVARVLP